MVAGVALAALAATTTACGTGEPSADGAAAAAVPSTHHGPTPITYHLVDYGFEGPGEVPAGPVRLTVVNDADQLHHLTLVKLRDGVSFDEVAHAAHAGDAAAVEAKIVDIGGINALDPHATGVAEFTIDEPGQYALVCFVPDREGRSHLTHDMVKPLTVTPSSGASAATDRPAATVDLRDFAYAVDAPHLSPGPGQVLRFRNQGTQPHEAIVVKLDEGKTFADLLGYFGGLAGGTVGPGDRPPGEVLGGPAAVAPGRSIDVVLDLEPGTYALFCAIPDPIHGGTPHVLEGMHTEITVG
jgi:uncharacterized cupredoxin-like copper-binding protein